MRITVLADVIMPNSVIQAGVRGKNIRSNTRSANRAGFQNINIDWNKTLRQYELGFVPMQVPQWQAIEGLHEVTEGGAYGFLMEDPKDCTVSGGLLLSAGSINSVGDGGPVYQLTKRYASVGTTRTKDRSITRIKSMEITRGGVAVPGANYSQTLGAVTFVADATQSLSSVTVGASTVLNFANGTGIVAALAVGQRVYLTGITGTAAATLNAKAHTITAKGATSLTVSTATTGLTATSGNAFKYPQVTDLLAWSGRFYVPVHFMNDDIDWELVTGGDADSRFLAGPSTMLQEVRE